MHVYVTKHGDTLRKIADRYYCEIESLLLLNPFISNVDLHLVADVQIKLPASLLHVRRIHDDAVSCPPEPSGLPLNQWIPLTPIEQMAQTDYDVLIIGSGAGGGAALWR
ncbi:LysM domain-containing protein, partial [Paenibacillus sp. TAF58]